MRDLIQDPLWQADDLGGAIPDSPHAVSACLPTWQDNIDYEEQQPRVHDKMTTGYPRFVYNRFCRDLFAECESRFAEPGEHCLVFPSQPAAERFVAFLEKQNGVRGRFHDFGLHQAVAVRFPGRHAEIAKSFWQHTGEGIGSRHAEACLSGQSAEEGDAAKRTLRERIAGLAGAWPDDVFLFPCGMNALYALHRVLNSLFSGRKSVQFGFPYVDTLKIQEKFGPGVHFFPRGDCADLEQLSALLEGENISGLFTEFPSNPLLACPAVESLAGLARRHEFPLILDETIASFVNVDLLSVSDVLWTSLTKFFSGVGDVAGGSLVLNRNSPFFGELSSRLRDETEDLFWGADAVVLERNARDFGRRVPEINTNAEALADYLHGHPKVAHVFYPKYQTPGLYRAYRKGNGGYSGLLSMVLENAPTAAPRVFDALRICKGPNLGTNYSMACPFTILAHYGELDFAESCGVSRWLIRITVGLEEPDDLIRRFERALSIA